MASTDDLLKELLDYFVAPLLPLKPSPTEASLHDQQQVAKQIYAVVMLFNYYHPKQCPGGEFLSFREFSELAVLLKPSLRAHMKLTNISERVHVARAEAKASVTETSILDACDLCMHLNASKKEPNVEGWPVSGIAVLLTDSDKYCSLEIDSITQGSWSLFEKSLDHLPADFDMRMQKRKTVIDGLNVDEPMCLQLALYAVKEARGINPNDLVVLESHNVYSLTTARTSVRFYIMQYNQSLGEDIRLPIKRVIDSMQGPLVEKHSSSWYTTSVVEYFHVLPYAAIITEWFSSQVNNDKLKELRLDIGSTN